MRALSLWEPWASLMAHEEKHVETRHWTTSYRGAVIIQAAKNPAEIGPALISPPFREALARHGIQHMAHFHLGKALAVGWLYDIVHTEDLRDQLSPQELLFGNYAAGRYAWQFKDIVLLPEPVELKGQQGLWTYYGKTIPVDWYHAERARRWGETGQ